MSLYRKVFLVHYDAGRVTKVEYHSDHFSGGTARGSISWNKPYNLCALYAHDELDAYSYVQSILDAENNTLDNDTTRV